MAKVGAPTIYNEDILAKAQEYEKEWETLKDPVPLLVGLSIHCGICESTRKKWCKDNDKPEFAAICARVKAMQERELLKKGLTRKYDNSLTKLMLMRHGYSDRQEIDHTTKGEKLGSTATSEELSQAKKDIIEKLDAENIQE